MKRAVCTILRLVAGGFVVFGSMQLGLEYLRHRVKQTESAPWQYVIGSTLFVLGVSLFALSNPLAARLTDESDDSGDPDDPNDSGNES